MARFRVRSRQVLLGALVAIVAVGACVLVGSAHLGEVDNARQGRLDDLATIADLKVRQVKDWRRERFYDAYWLTRSKPFRDAVTRVLEPPRPGSSTYAHARTRISEHLELYTELEAYRNAVLLDAQGRVMAAANGEHVDLGAGARELAALSLALGRPVIGDPYIGTTGDVHFRSAAPVLDPEGRPIAAVILLGDPEPMLYADLLTSSLLPDEAETVLATEVGDGLMLLSESRLEALPVGSRISLAAVDDTARRDLGRLRQVGPPAGSTRPDPPTMESWPGGEDLLGRADALSEVRTVPDSGWLLLTRSRAAPLAAIAAGEFGDLLLRVGMAALAGLLVAAVAFLVRQRRLLQRVTEAEHVGRVATARLDQTMAQARDIVLLVDAQGRILEANPAGERAYGYDQPTLRGMRLAELRPAGERARVVADLAAANRPGGTLYETVHRRADGSTFPVEVSAKAITVDGMLQVEEVVRDISDRQAAERAIRRQIDELRRWQAGTIGREERILGLKGEVNELLVASGRPARYASVQDGAPEHVA